MRLRRARATDLAFLVTAVREAERVPATGRTTYERIYNLSADELTALLERVLPMDGEGHPLTWRTYFLLEDETGPIATCAAWSEAADGVASSFKVAALLAGELGPERWNAAKSAIRAFAAAAPVRTPGALQLEMFYVTPAHRGRGATKELIEKILGAFPDAPSAEIALLSANRPALQAYRKAGFQPVSGKAHPVDALFRELTGSDGFLQLKKLLTGV